MKANDRDSLERRAPFSAQQSGRQPKGVFVAQAEAVYFVDEAVVLRGGECRACGFVFFPFQHLGCERCGAFAESLRERSLTPAGVIENAAVVHIAPPSIGIAAPFQVARIALADGPVIAGLLSTTDVQAHGAAVVAMLAPGGEDRPLPQRICFAPVNGPVA
jgi:uncharacterized OB-fold protein